MKQLSLSGTWSLCGFEQGTHRIDAPSELQKINKEIKLDATVPGEVQLELSKAGILPKDLFMGMNIREAEDYETYEWWYERDFEAPSLKEGQRLFIRFEGVDCLAEYYLNDEMFAESDNAMIPHEFEITDIVNKGTNKISVRLRSPRYEAYEMEYPLYESAFKGLNPESVHIRKPAHSFGWDIMPRAIASGLWKDVSLEVKNEVEIKQIYLVTGRASMHSAELFCLYELDCPIIRRSDSYKLKILATCGSKSFSYESSELTQKAGRIHNIYIPNPELWWPHGYGEPNLYDVEVTLTNNGKTVAESHFTTGIRTAKLIRSEITDGKNGCFKFNVNGVDIMAKGTNWVPLDAFHSRDAERLPKAFAMVADLECNIVRCWGGNVYESDEFYNLCDRNGVMVWQDFGMACHYPPHTDLFKEQIKKEVAEVVKSRRHHPSIVLWAGDNEVDQMTNHDAIPSSPEINRINREIVPGEVYRHDRTRSYLCSSPFISKEIFEAPLSDFKTSPENHIWGPRDYFKSRFYTENAAHFISETGYHGCPARKSLEKFITADKLWPYVKNEEWILHSSDQHGRDGRVMLMENQIRQLFGEVPDNLDGYAVASQFSQGEAKKFMIERMRCGKPTKSGVIWWNLIDGWPQLSDAIVDYFYEKKLAYDYIKRSQKPFCMMFDEIDNWNITLVAANDTLTKKAGLFKVFEVSADGEISEIKCGGFEVGENGIGRFARIPVMYSDKRMFIITWKCDDGETGYNHYLAGMPPFDLATYTKQMNIVNHFDISKLF